MRDTVEMRPGIMLRVIPTALEDGGAIWWRTRMPYFCRVTVSCTNRSRRNTSCENSAMQNRYFSNVQLLLQHPGRAIHLEACKTSIRTRMFQTRAKKDHINVKILQLSISGIPRTFLHWALEPECQILMRMWSFGPLQISVLNLGS